MNQFHLFLVTGLSAVASSVFLPLSTAHAEPQPVAAVAPTAARPAAAVHRLGQHPAVLVHAQARGIDPNRFIVQPPASVTWRMTPEADPAMRWAAPVTPTATEALGDTSTSAAGTSIASQGS